MRASLCVTLVCGVPWGHFLSLFEWHDAVDGCIDLHCRTDSVSYCRVPFTSDFRPRNDITGHFSAFQLQSWKTRWQPLWNPFAFSEYKQLLDKHMGPSAMFKHVHCLHTGSHLWKQGGISDISSRKSDLRGCSSRNFQLGTWKFPLLVAATIERPSHVSQ